MSRTLVRRLMVQWFPRMNANLYLDLVSAQSPIDKFPKTTITYRELVMKTAAA